MATRLIAAMSLMETLIAVTVMSTAAIMYASAWKTHGGFSDVAREIELATEIYLRQVERIRSKSVLDGFNNPNQKAPFTETSFTTPGLNYKFGGGPPHADAPPPPALSHTPGGKQAGESYYESWAA